ncbi:MAG: dockerin type I domain-containing protein, partial [Rubrivivax sp.]|nr:dockerin type I domain-containing protein [Rubrivivax sp.]
VVESNANGFFDCSAASCESRDERVAWTSVLPAGEASGLGRALCIGTDGNLWVGVYGTSRYYKMRASDGVLLSGPHAIGVTPYGCLIDGAGMLWSASLSTVLGRLDTSSPGSTTTFTDGSSTNYGIALGNGKVYLASLSGFGFRQFDPGSSAFSTPGGSKGFSSTGISVDGSGNIWTGPYTTGGVSKYNAAGTLLCSGANQFVGSIETRGVIVDADNNIWQINRHTNSVAKYRGSDCAPQGTYPVGFDPYTYSDATGFAARNITTPTGTWTVVNDSGASGQAWSKVSWTDSVPAGAAVLVSARADNVQANLSSLPFVPVSNGANPGLTGRFIQVQVRLNAAPAGTSPVLFDLSLQTPDTTCDVDRDGDIDQLDLALISRARNQPATGPDDPRDADGDRRITPNDVKVCIPKCTRPNCATQ